MINELFDFFKSSIQGLMIAILIFVLGALFISDNIAWNIIKRIKPNIKKNINLIFIRITNIFVNNAVLFEGNLEDINNKKMENINDGQEKIKILEKNIFILDSLIGLFDMLSFIVNKGFNREDMYETILEYFQCYCRSIQEIKDIDLRDIIYGKFYMLSDELHKQIIDYQQIENESTENYYSRAQQMDKLMNEFRTFLQQKKKEQENLLDSSKKEVVINVKDILEEI